MWGFLRHVEKIGLRQSFMNYSIRGYFGSTLSYASVYSFEGNNPKTWVFTSKPASRVQLKTIAAYLKKSTSAVRVRRPSWLSSDLEFSQVRMTITTVMMPELPLVRENAWRVQAKSSSSPGQPSQHNLPFLSHPRQVADASRRTTP